MTSSATTVSSLAENFFRHEYGRLVSSLSRRVGLAYMEQVEDSVQSALVKGLESWTLNGLPDNPEAWLYKVASNHLLERLRQNNNQQRILSGNTEDIFEFLIGRNSPSNPVQQKLSDEPDCDLLRLLFVCCNDDVPQESQLVFALKALCGFNVIEISKRIFSSEENVYKRYSRAKKILQKLPTESWDLSASEYHPRLPNVHKVIYLLFTEGYLSANGQHTIRLDLCLEAIRLATVLSDYTIGQYPETYALLALMHLHLARMTGRQSQSGGLLLLEEQDRSLWDKSLIAEGIRWIEMSATGDNFSRYHAEAGVAAEHCLASNYQDTRWQQIASCYEILEKKLPSAIHRLNRAIAVAEWKGPKAGLEILIEFEPPSWLLGSHLWFAVLADLHRRCGNFIKARGYYDHAIGLAPTNGVRQLIKRRFDSSF